MRVKRTGGIITKGWRIFWIQRREYSARCILRFVKEGKLEEEL
jgi:hypothetical protein